MARFKPGVLEYEFRVRGRSDRVVADECGLSPNTIMAAKAGKAVSATTLALLLKWLEQNPPLHAEAARLLVGGHSS